MLSSRLWFPLRFAERNSEQQSEAPEGEKTRRNGVQGRLRRAGCRVWVRVRVDVASLVGCGGAWGTTPPCGCSLPLPVVLPSYVCSGVKGSLP